MAFEGDDASRETVVVDDYYGDGDWYDAEYVHIRGDIPYYEKVAREALDQGQGRILELACGTGRLSFPMMEVGATVFGIDVSKGMLERAEVVRAELPPSRRMRIQFQRGDMRTFRADAKFDAVVLGFNTLMHMLEDDDLLATLHTARAHLDEDGLFHLDLHTPLPEITRHRDPDGRYDPEEMIDRRDGARYVVTENNTYDPRRQINQMRFYYQRVDHEGLDVGPERCAQVELRVLFPRELDLFLRLAGFEIVGDWDDFDLTTQYSGGGGRRIIMAQPLPAAPTIALP